MKKFLISIAAICAVIFFVSCGGNSSDKKDGSNSGNNTEDENGGNGGEEGGNNGSEEGGNNGGEEGGNNGSEEGGNNGGETGDKTDSDSGNNGGETSDGDNNGGETNDGDNNGGETDDGDNNGGETDDGDNTGENCEPNELYEKFIGRWAAEIILNSESSTSSVLAKDIPSITTRFVLVDFYVNDKCQLDMKKVDNKLCRTDNRTGGSGALQTFTKGNVKFNEPYKFNTIFWHWKPYEISGREDTPYVEVAQNGEEISFKLNKDYELRGACKHKEDCNPAANDDKWFVTGKDDPNIFDHDNDGHQAFTIGFNSQVPSAASGDMYYVQKLTHIFNGKLIADDKIEGNVEWSDTQFTHSATKSNLEDSKTTVTFTEKSIFQFRKVANDMNCDALLEQLNTVFDLVDPNAGDAVGKE